MKTSDLKEALSKKEGTFSLTRWVSRSICRLTGRTIKKLPENMESRSQLLRRCTETSETFQLFLRERALEVKQEGEEKRLEGLRRIADMKSREGINPLELFPREIWIKILEKLQPEDRASMFGIHDIFSSLLENNLVSAILLPLVLDYKVALLQDYLLPPRPYLSRRCQGYQDIKPLMVLRRVSKSLRNSVDCWIESRLLHFMRNVELSSFNSPILDLNTLQLGTCHSEFERKLNRIIVYSRGPAEKRPERFIVRSLHIAFYCSLCSDYDISTDDMDDHGRSLQERFPIFIDNITEFLQSVGDQVLHLILKLPSAVRFARYGMPLSHAEIYEIVREWLLLMPNLRWLQIDASSMVMDHLPQDHRNGVVFPTLRKLERFDFQGCRCNKLFPMWHSVIAANPQIKRINILKKPTWRYYAPPQSDVGPEIQAYNDPAVLTLPLEAAHFGRRYLRPSDYALIKQIPETNNWNLKRLTLWMRYRKHPYSLDRIFSLLGKFQTLENLEIKMNIISYFWIGGNFLHLPNLKHFKFEFGPAVKSKSPEDTDLFFSLMFLLECSKLESLVWKNCLCDALSIWSQLKERKRMIDFMGGFEDLSESNVWDVYPKLEYIRIKFRTLNGLQMGSKCIDRKYRKRQLVSESNEKWLPSL